MTDIVDRLRTWCHRPDAQSAQDLMDEAAEEIRLLRNGAAGYTDGISPDDKTKAVLTDEEREAVRMVAAVVSSEEIAATLRKMLERLG